MSHFLVALLTLPVQALSIGQEIPAEELQRVCGFEEGGGVSTICEGILRLTGPQAGLVARWSGMLIPSLFRLTLIVVLAWLVNRIARRTIKRFVQKVKNEGVSRLGTLRSRGPLAVTGPVDLARSNLRTATIGGVLHSFATVVIYGIAFALILGVLGVQLGPLLAGAGIVGLALGFGAQNLVRDFLAGMFILLEDQYGIGDIVTIGDATTPVATGVVEGITLRQTRLRDVHGTVWHVPNGEIRAVGNRSQLWARSLLDIGLAYETDIAHATTVIKEVADAVWKDPQWSTQVLEEPQVWGIEDFGPNEIVLRLVLKVEPSRQWAVNREVRRRLLEAFDREGIEIPFPQRTVWVRMLTGDDEPPRTRRTQEGT
ncbi:MAG: mechanosensitive ion channel [Nitriliruptorales bacterium]|nr:mechanosensitive ion channel [Nitriliruptorales bacterium]